MTVCNDDKITVTNKLYLMWIWQCPNHLIMCQYIIVVVFLHRYTMTITSVRAQPINRPTSSYHRDPSNKVYVG